MDQNSFITRFQSEIRMYDEWGQQIKQVIEEELLKKSYDLSSFIKIPAIPRVKKIDSLLAKAFYRNKNYANPYDDITDKVGIRFVLLLEEDVKAVCDIIDSNVSWNVSLDRDFEKERNDKPELFDYKSMHYIVRNKADIMCNGVVIKENTPCEIQVRTLLQHAYAEMAHDQIYKNKQEIIPEIKRIVARSMALIEATDKFFSDASRMIYDQEHSKKCLLDRLYKIYESKLRKTLLNEKLNLSVMNEIDGLIETTEFESILEYLDDNPIVYELISQNYEKYLIFRQPVILILFYLVDKRQSTLLSKWEITPDYIRVISALLGISLDLP